LSIAVRASGYIYFKEYGLTSHIIYAINTAYGSDVVFKTESNNIVSIDIFGQNGIDYEPLEKILKDNKEFLEDEVVINEWVENNGGGLYFDPEEEEDCSD